MKHFRFKHKNMTNMIGVLEMTMCHDDAHELLTSPVLFDIPRSANVKVQESLTCGFWRLREPREHPLPCFVMQSVSAFVSDSVSVSISLSLSLPPSMPCSLSPSVPPSVLPSLARSLSLSLSLSRDLSFSSLSHSLCLSPYQRWQPLSGTPA